MDKYINRFDPVKNYVDLLFISGKKLQSAELNEILETVLYQLKEISTALIKSGTVISGGQVESITPKNITISKGKVFIEGLSLYVESATLDLNGYVQTIGVGIKSVVVTAIEDPELVELDTASLNVGKEGASRKKLITTWKLSTEISGDEQFFPVFTVNNGEVVITSNGTKEKTENLLSSLSEYDTETKGNYSLNGFDASYSGINPDINLHAISISAGVARIGGNKVTLQSPKSAYLDLVSEFDTVHSEPYPYNGIIYKTRKFPIKEIISVQGTKQVLSQITHGGYQGISDELPNTPVVKILFVNQGGSWNGTAFVGGTNYNANTDYSISGDTIDWSKPGAEPAPGSTYSVVYQYINVVKPEELNDDRSGFKLSDTFVDGTILLVDYTYFLKRVDRVSLDKFGNLIVNKGIAGWKVVQNPPKNSDLLSLCTVFLEFEKIPKITLDSVVNVNLVELQELKSKVSELEMMIARLSLLDTSRSYASSESKRSIVVDPLVNRNMLDLNEDNTCFIDVKTNTVTIQSVFSKTYTSSAIHRIRGSLVSFQQQKYVTDSQKINFYAAPDNPLVANLTMNPVSVNMNRWRWWYEASNTTTPAAFDLTLNFSKFDGGEDVVVFFDNMQVGRFKSNGLTTVTKTITIPAGIQSGIHNVVLIGVYSFASAVCRLTVNTSESIMWPPPPPPPPPPPRPPFNWVWIDVPNRNAGNAPWDLLAYENPPGTPRDTLLYRYVAGLDPIAQTFFASGTFDMSAAAVVIDELPKDDLFIKLVAVKLGIPDRTQVLTSGRLALSSIVKGWNTVVFDIPHRIISGQEYAIIVVTSKPTGTVRTAKIGNYDIVNNAWIKSQAADGVLLISANESTWTPVQDQDMAYELFRNQYIASTPATTSNIFNILSVSDCTNVTDWMFHCDKTIPPECSIKIQLVLSNATYEIEEGILLRTLPYTGVANLVATMCGTELASPMIANVDMQTGNLAASSIYVQRSLNIPDAATNSATVRFAVSQYAPTNTTLKIFVETARGVFIEMTVESLTPIGDGWFEVVYVTKNITYTTPRIKIDMNSVGVEKPAVKNIRTIVS